MHAITRHARIRQMTFGTGSAQEVRDRLEADVLPIYLDSPGYVSYSIVWADVSTLITIRVFDDLDTLEAANAAASAASAQIVADFAVAPSEPSEGEVILFDSI